jgi:transposase-like protein
MQEKKSLLNGHMLRCPRCKKEHSIESYMRLAEAKEFEHETNPIYKCESCKWIFSLAVPAELYEKLTELLSSKASIAKVEEERK